MMRSYIHLLLHPYTGLGACRHLLATTSDVTSDFKVTIIPIDYHMIMLIPIHYCTLGLLDTDFAFINRVTELFDREST
jgi:hypothetical protein